MHPPRLSHVADTFTWYATSNKAYALAESASLLGVLSVAYSSADIKGTKQGTPQGPPSLQHDGNGSSHAKKKHKVSKSTIVIVLVLLVGLGIMLYPTISDWWNSMHQSRAIASYDEAVAAMDDADIEQMFAQAEAYNNHLDQLASPLTTHSKLSDEYYNTLDITGTGIMGYVNIPSINVKLPIYHGTSDTVLAAAAGHLEGTHLPIGGTGRHAVISAHRGLPSAMLFTRLDELDVGDYFAITVLDEELAYQVDQVLIVEPRETAELTPVVNEDLVTLQTCTPYGVNSHRLLVRGHRVDGMPVDAGLSKDATRVPTYMVAAVVVIPILLALLIGLLISYRRRPVSVNQAQEVIESYAQSADVSQGMPNAPDDKTDDDTGFPGTFRP